MKRFKVLFGNRRMMVLLTLAVLVLAATALDRVERELHGHVGQPRQHVHGRHPHLTDNGPTAPQTLASS